MYYLTICHKVEKQCGEKNKMTEKYSVVEVTAEISHQRWKCDVTAWAVKTVTSDKQNDTAYGWLLIKSYPFYGYTLIWTKQLLCFKWY